MTSGQWYEKQWICADFSVAMLLASSELIWTECCKRHHVLLGLNGMECPQLVPNHQAGDSW